MSTAFPTTILRTGVEIPTPLVRTTYLNLQLLMEKNPIAFYELVTLARKPDHQLFPGTESALDDLHFTDGSGRLHTACRDLVLAAVDGEDESMTLLPYTEIIRTA
ncbi:hypothetical protein [Nocardia tengchongensis]|uniref:hypothetical protein n=1 Tax=Nocardia tengchongensis TaxID=2055889 RepID=UPI00365F88F3